jgi:hypothetical protein
MKTGDYIGLYIDNKLIYTGVLKDFGKMESGRMAYQVLLVKNIFQRNFPEIHFDRYSPRHFSTIAGRNQASQNQPDEAT